MKNHPASELFPMLPDEALQVLAENIKTNGLQQPIYRLDGKIIDGRNRMKACEIADLEPWFEDLDPGETGDPFAFVMSLNFHRRHLDPIERGRALRQYLEAKGGKKRGKGRPSKNGHNGHLPGVGSIAKELGVPRKTAERHIADLVRYVIQI